MKRKVPVFRVSLPQGVSYDILTKTPEIQKVVIDETVFAIKDGLGKNKKSISLFEIANSEFYIELERDKWKITLEKAIEYYAQSEDYDKCIECRDLITKL